MIKTETTSLAITHPELSAQWHPTKNGELKPTDVTAGSGKKVWWYLPYDVPIDYPVKHLRGKHFDFEWEASPNGRSRGQGCPYLSNPAKAVWQGFNDLTTTHPTLVKEWHPIKNKGLVPEMVTAGSAQKAWWQLPYNVPMDYPVEHLRGKYFNFEWETNINNRIRREYSCPYLSGKAVWQGFNDLATIYPELAKQWHPSKNGDLKPCDVTYGSGKKVWWLLPYDVPMDYPVKHLRGKHFNFEWEASICHRSKGRGCPYITGQVVWKGFNDLTTTHPELAKEWHPTKNGDIKPTDVMPFSNKKVWWHLPYDDPITGKHFDFEWEANINNRTQGKGCPYLSGQSIWVGFNDLATTHPHLAEEWHPARNGNLKPTGITAGSDKKVWWYLPYDVPEDYPIEHLRGKHFDFEWEAIISNRTSEKSICPYLTGHAVREGFNDLATSHPELARQWHPIKNGKLTPENVTRGYDKKAWWIFPYDVPMDYPIEHLRGKHFDFEWESFVYTRSKGDDSCPYLSNPPQLLMKGFNDLQTVNPTLAAEWHPTKNGSLTPSDVFPSSSKKVWWMCEQGHEWETAPNHRSNGTGCPVCAESHGEKAVRKALEDNHISFKEQYKFKDRGFLRDDFAIFGKDDNVVGTIEYHGQQHYEPVDFAGKGDKWAWKQLELTQKRDKAKTNYLKVHNIPQLIIPYWDFDNIEEIVKKFVNELSDNYDILNVKMFKKGVKE